MSEHAPKRSGSGSPSGQPEESAGGPGSSGSLFTRLKKMIGIDNGSGSARDTLDELIEEREESELPINEDERMLLSNILNLRDRTVHDVMIPRADIIAIHDETTMDEIIDLITKEGHSRIPVYKEDMDDASGVIHAKDVLAWRGDADVFTPAVIQRKILFVSPGMRVLELLLEMRVQRLHMALVVDEFGGVDGLVTIEDLVEEIVGEIEDEHDTSEAPKILQKEDGSYIADARLSIEDCEQVLGKFATEEEHEHIDTLGGLTANLAGYIPTRNELLIHPSGLKIEVLEADPRRVKKLRLSPAKPEQAKPADAKSGTNDSEAKLPEKTN